MKKPKFRKRDAAYTGIIAFLVIALVASWSYFLATTNTDLANENSVLRSSLASHNYLIYGGAHNFPGDFYGSEFLPDTFDYHDDWTSTAPIMVYYLSGEQYVQYVTCKASEKPIGCVTGQIQTTIGPTEESNDTFTLGEGCADYVAVYQATGQAGILYPNVTVTYAPSTTLTGVCGTD